MLNISNLVTSRQTFRVELTRKPTINEGQNIRTQVEYVQAEAQNNITRIEEKIQSLLCIEHKAAA